MKSEQEIHNLVGTRVRVTSNSSPDSTHHFLTAITIDGTLEQHPSPDHATVCEYRVVITDGCYAYFNLSDVTLVMPTATDTPPAIFLKIQ